MVSGDCFVSFLLVSWVCAMIPLGFVALVYGVWGWCRAFSLGFVCLRDGVSWFGGGCVWCPRRFVCFLMVSCVCIMLSLGLVVVVYGVWGWLRLFSVSFVCLRDVVSWLRGVFVRYLVLVSCVSIGFVCLRDVVSWFGAGCV